MPLFVPPLSLPTHPSRSAHARTVRRPRSPPIIRASSSSRPSWSDELRLLLDPSLNPSARQVLLQDLAKRSPEILNDLSCSSVFEGLSDVARQVSDVLPDLVANGGRYAENIPSAISRSRSRSRSRDVDFASSMPSSPEDIAREVRNVFNRTPEGLFTPQYDVIKEGDQYEIRRYPSMIVATTRMGSEEDGPVPTEIEAASAMSDSFSELAGYLFGGNKEKEPMKMTTPVVLSKGVPEESMSFIIGEYQRVEDVPDTLDDSVVLREEPGKVYAVCEFTGYVTQGEAKRQRERLLRKLSEDKIDTAEEGSTAYKCMIYNGPSTLPNLRRNEMMIEVVYDAGSSQ